MSFSDFVSVTIVTYNSGRFIKRCLDSVLDQKYPHMEIIVIDNASDDGTIDLGTGYDCLDALAAPSNALVGAVARRDRQLLKSTMQAAGFRPIPPWSCGAG